MQPGQKSAPAATGVPQTGHGAVSPPPHAGHHAAPSGITAPQVGQEWRLIAGIEPRAAFNPANANPPVPLDPTP